MDEAWNLYDVPGGQHFRGWRQNGTDANTGAWFLACVCLFRNPNIASTYLTNFWVQKSVSEEKYLAAGHIIVDDGYNKGRDWLVEKSVKGSLYNVGSSFLYLDYFFYWYSVGPLVESWRCMEGRTTGARRQRYSLDTRVSRCLHGESNHLWLRDQP